VDHERAPEIRLVAGRWSLLRNSGPRATIARRAQSTTEGT
jgi:hypothetical protein